MSLERDGRRTIDRTAGRVPGLAPAVPGRGW